MTISVVETVAVAGLTLTFAAAQPRDLVIISLKYFWSGATTPIIDLSPFTAVASTASQDLAWKELAAGETTFTFTATHTASQQLVAIVLRNDAGPDVEPLLDELAPTHTTVGTDFADDCVLVVTGSETGYGTFNLGTWAVAVNLANVAIWTRVPFQVPLGTSLRVEGTGSTNFLSLMAFRPWHRFTEPPTPADGGWTAWVVD